MFGSGIWFGNSIILTPARLLEPFIRSYKKPNEVDLIPGSKILACLEQACGSNVWVALSVCAVGWSADILLGAKSVLPRQPSNSFPYGAVATLSILGHQLCPAVGIFPSPQRVNVPFATLLYFVGHSLCPTDWPNSCSCKHTFRWFVPCCATELHQHRCGVKYHKGAPFQLHNFRRPAIAAGDRCSLSPWV